ncbi:MAG: hypothetical protein VX899_25550 [Myxococcota bacterium]|nr:hypothetical protein [Myxococcota bacterium]
MALFDKIKKRLSSLLSGIDEMEDAARADDPMRTARELSVSGGGAQEVSGGVDDLEELELDAPTEEVALLSQDDLLEVSDPALEELSVDVDDEPSHIELQDDRPPLEALLGPAHGLWELSHEDTEEVTELAVPASSLARLSELGDATESFAPLEEDVTEVTDLRLHAELEPIAPAPLDEQEVALTEAGDIWTAAEPTLGLDEDANDEPSEDFGLGGFSWHEEEAEAPSVSGLRFPNSLQLPDVEVARLLREEHYPELVQASDESLLALARVDRALLHQVRALGESVGRLLTTELPAWESAVMWSCIRLDPTLREHWGPEMDGEAWRRVAWAAWPYLSELLLAADTPDDPFTVEDTLASIRSLLEQRRELAEADAMLQPAMDRLPVEDCGLYALEGFEWSR